MDPPRKAQLLSRLQFPSDVTVTTIAAGSYANIPGQPGGDYNLALASTGAVYGWGNNLYGTIGNGAPRRTVTSPTLTITSTASPPRTSSPVGTELMF